MAADDDAEEVEDDKLAKEDDFAGRSTNLQANCKVRNSNDLHKNYHLDDIYSNSGRRKEKEGNTYLLSQESTHGPMDHPDALPISCKSDDAIRFRGPKIKIKREKV